jgi:hypothetical protein
LDGDIIGPWALGKKKGMVGTETEECPLPEKPEIISSLKLNNGLAHISLGFLTTTSFIRGPLHFFSLPLWDWRSTFVLAGWTFLSRRIFRQQRMFPFLSFFGGWKFVCNEDKSVKI